MTNPFAVGVGTANAVVANGGIDPHGGENVANKALGVVLWPLCAGYFTAVAAFDIGGNSIVSWATGTASDYPLSPLSFGDQINQVQARYGGAANEVLEAHPHDR